MFKNYLKIAVRTLWRSKGYAFINILGLAIGITGATLLLTFVKDENAFDMFHSKAERIVRPIAKQLNLEEPRYFASSPGILAQVAVEELPEVEMQTTLAQVGGQMNFQLGELRFSERGYFLADSSFFEVFDFEFAFGNREGALSEPMKAVLTEAEAIKFFGRTDVLDEVVSAPGIGEFKITGVLKNLPANSHLQFDILLSMYSLPANRYGNVMNNWTSFGGTSYLLTVPGTDVKALGEKLEALSDERMPENFANLVDFEVQALSDVHFGSAHIEADFAANKDDRAYSRIFLAIAIFLLVIAAVNYMNLATSRAVFRAKEIGIRKVVGAVKRQLVSQFLLESVIITLIALLISIGLTDISMPLFNEFTQKNFQFNWETLSNYLPLLLGIAVSVGVLSGIYPSFFMTRFRPVQVLKGEKVSGGSFSLRKALVVFQFILSIILIISTLIVTDQMHYIKEKNLGFNDEGLLVIDINNGAVRPVFKTMRSDFEAIPGVESVAVSSRVPGEWKNISEVGIGLYDDSGFVRDSANVFLMNFDENMLGTFDFKLKEGSYFTGNDQTDSTKILINEAAVAAFNLSNPIGATIQMEVRGGRLQAQVIGVLEDFNFQSLHTQIEPIIIGAWNNPGALIDYFTLKVSGDIPRILESAAKVHERFDNRTAMEYHFLDNQLELFYENEQRASTIFKAGAGLSIFVACLGLFGLASFTVQKRVKEMGIRKVLGASSPQLFYLLSRSFAKQVLLAFLIASPFAYWIMHNWLSNFTYSVGISVWAFLLAGVASLVVALITVSYRSLKAANSNPVSSLRHE